MYEFIILGLIPGTNFQISFGFVLAVALTLLACVAVRQTYHSTTLRQTFYAYLIAREIKLAAKLI